MKNVFVFQTYIEFLSEYDGSVLRVPIADIQQYKNDNLIYDFRIDDLPPESRAILGNSEDPIAIRLLNNFPSRTKEELRSYMVVSPAQIRLALFQHGISLSAIDTAIDGISDSMQKETAYILWNYAIEFHRDHAFVSAIGALLNKTEEEIDAIFTTAMAIE